MEDKDFLEKASELFLKYGPKTFTMDDIAKEFRISKKTLYQKYKNKETLLEDVVAFRQDRIVENFKKSGNDTNPIDKMYCRDEQMENAIEENDSLFIKQMMKYYPEIYEKSVLEMSKRMSEILYQNIIKGREMGLYREDFDANLYAKFLFHLMISYHNTSYMEEDEMKKSDYCHLVLDFYMNAITTEKGRKLIKN